VIVAAAAALLPASPATAGDGVGSVDCIQDPSNPACNIEVSTPGNDGTNGTTTGVACHDPSGHPVPCYVDGFGWLADDGCYYRPATEIPAGADSPAPKGHWYVGTCGYPPNEDVTKYRWFENPPGAALLAQHAVKALRPARPVIRTNPALPAAQLVHLPSWIWLDRSSWTPRTATASVPGMSVTATATPIKLEIQPDHEHTIRCSGPGSPWTRGMNPARSSPDCGHTYTRAGTFTLTATITWAVTWAGGGETGTAPALTTTASVPVRVMESQAVVTR